jgi:hypothetical protein
VLQQTILLTAPPGQPPTSVAPPDFADQLEHVDVTVSDTDVVVEALDARGDPIGMLALWVDDAGTTWIAVDFADGSGLFGTKPDGEIVRRESNLNPEAAALRVDAMLEHLDGAVEDNSWGECGWKAAQAGGACFFARPFACVFGSIRAACACVPKLVQEFEGYECPWGL